MGLFKKKATFDAAAELSPGDQVWNRACEGDDWPPVFGEDVPEGDRRLAYLVMFDSYAQGDGLLDAMSHLGSDGTREAMEAFRWLGLPKLADVVQRAWDEILPAGTEWTHEMDLHFDVLDVESMDDAAMEALEQKTEKLEDQYYAAADGIMDKWERFYEAHPEHFAPPVSSPGVSRPD